MPHPRTWGPELCWPSQGNWTFPHANVINELVKLWCISAISKLTRCPSVLHLTRLDFFHDAEFCFSLFAEAPGVQGKTHEVAQPHSPRAQGTCAGSPGSIFPSRGRSGIQSKIGTTQRGGLWYQIWSPLMYGWGHILESDYLIDNLWYRSYPQRKEKYVYFLFFLLERFFLSHDFSARFRFE